MSGVFVKEPSLLGPQVHVHSTPQRALLCLHRARLERASVGVCTHMSAHVTLLVHADTCPCGLSTPFPHTGVDTDELDSNVEDWEEETIEFFVTEEIIPLGSPE